MNLLPRDQVIQQFGSAALIRHGNGKHDLVGGSNADRMEAAEWVSLFAHEIVFQRFPYQTTTKRISCGRVSPHREKPGPLLT
jgi:hypothetical protein